VPQDDTCQSIADASLTIDSKALEPVDDAHARENLWANCGPTAIAAALGIRVADVRPAVQPWRGYMGVREFRSAIPRAGGRIVRSWSKPIGLTDPFDLDYELADATIDTGGHPIVVMVRFCGPWDGVPRAAATYRHAFAYRRVFVRPLERFAQRAHGPGWVCDVNNWSCSEAAPWLPAYSWRNLVLVGMLPERGNGTVAIDWMAQVERVRSTERQRSDR